jgi:predicted AAA+ superfamily ATPase
MVDLLTGSSALNMANLTQEPLTGRKWEYFLYPISCAEIVGYTGAPELLRGLSQYLVYGCYPEVVTNLNNARQILNNSKSKFPSSFIEAYKPVKSDIIHRDNFWQWLKDYPY